MACKPWVEKRVGAAMEYRIVFPNSPRLERVSAQL
jgi:hypothetical protein